MKKFNWLLLLTVVLFIGVNNCMHEINRFNIDPIAWDKFDAKLKQKIAEYHANPNVEFPVMLVLAGSTEPSDSLQDRQAAFERETSDLLLKLNQLGTRDLKLFWINRTIGAKLKLPALEVAGQREEVKQIILIVSQKVLL